MRIKTIIGIILILSGICFYFYSLAHDNCSWFSCFSLEVFLFVSVPFVITGSIILFSIVGGTVSLIGALILPSFLTGVVDTSNYAVLFPALAFFGAGTIYGIVEGIIKLMKIIIRIIQKIIKK